MYCRIITFCFWVLSFCALPISAAIFTVQNTNDTGPGSFRQAIISANANAGVDKIEFRITNAPPYTIRPASAFPAVAEAAVIDGTTQSGFFGQPIVELNGSGAGFVTDGLLILGGHIVVRGLVINRFGGYGLTVANNGHNVIEGNFIGCDVGGTLSLPNGQAAIGVFEVGDNIIGGTAASNRNVIVGQSRACIFIDGTNAIKNQVLGNFVGVDITGQASLGSVSNGILVCEAPLNIIGGTKAGARNIISGNGQSGVYIFGPGARNNLVQGNFIGTDVTGSAAVSNLTDGVTLFNAASNVVGGAEAAARNIISANQRFGVFISGTNSTGNVVQGNFIGTDVSGTIDLGNALGGVGIDDAPGNIIGGTLPEQRNIVSGNDDLGIVIFGPSATSNRVQGNFIGTDVSGSNDVGNTLSGVGIDDAPGNIIGGTIPEQRNIISGNDQSGVLIFGLGATNNSVQGNFIGTDVSGNLALSNSYNGVAIYESCGNTIGGTTAGAGNLISGNFISGIFITNTTCSGNVVQGNFIGTTASGQAPLANGVAGVDLEESGRNIIGGTNDGARNIISGNEQLGIYISGLRATSNVIQGNFIGTGPLGTEYVGNLQDGIFIEGAPANLIGGAAPGAGNLISNNEDSGIYLHGPAASSNIVQGNFIGTDISGTAARGNRLDGVRINRGSGNLIGGPSIGAGNLISGNGNVGVAVFGTNGAARNKIQGNFIGTAPDGVTRLDNRLHGVELGDLDINDSPNTNVVGGLGLGEGNIIAYNNTDGFDGVRLKTGVGNLVSWNSILGHVGLGIDLGTDGVTLNDNLDPDSGANNLQNFPVLTSATNSTGNTVVQGTFNSKANQTFRLDFYANTVCNASGHGESQIFLGSTNILTAGTGSNSFTAILPVAVPSNYVITATATDAANNTSEFSTCRAVTGNAIAADLRITKVVSPDPVLVGSNLTYHITIHNDGPNHAYGVRLVETLPAGVAFVSATPGPSTRFGGTYTFDLGRLSNGMSMTISLLARSGVAGHFTNQASVSSAVPDPNQANNATTASVTATIEPPRLAISLENNQVTISWHTNSAGFRLEKAFGLNPPINWQPVTNNPAQDGDQKRVTLSIMGSNSFYRLQNP